MKNARRLGMTLTATWFILMTSVVVRANAAELAQGLGQLAPYARPDLPPLLEFLDGTPVRTMDDFDHRKQEIRRLFCQYFIGSFPEELPPIVAAEILEEHRKDDGSTRRRVKLTFNTPNNVSFEIWVWIPEGDGPFPLLLTQPRFYQIFWAEAGQPGGLTTLTPDDINRFQSAQDRMFTDWLTHEFPANK